MTQPVVFDLARNYRPSAVLGKWLAEERPGAAQRLGKADPEPERIQANLDRGSGPITHDQLVAALGGIPSSTGVHVNESTARRVSAVWGCVDRIAGAISSMPMHVYERAGDAPQRVDHPYWWLLNEQANENFTGAVLKEYMVASLLLQGDAFAEIQRPNARTNRVDGFLPHHPSRVFVRSTPEAGLLYDITDTEGNFRTVLAADMIHVPGLFFDGKRGLSVLSAAALEAVGISTAANDYSARFFAGGSQSRFVLSAPGKVDAEQIKLMKDQFQQNYAGLNNAHKPLLFTGGLKVEPISINPNDAMLLETRQFQVEEIARIFGVPPHMIGHTTGNTSWGTGIEQQSIGFVKYTLQRHLTKIEQEFNRKLWPVRERYYMKFLTAGLERGDMKTRNESYRIGLGRAGEPGWLTVNEVRRFEQLAPIQGGDVLNGAAPAAPTGANP